MTVNGYEAIISGWVAATNAHDTPEYLAYFTEDAVLDDASVGDQFEGHGGIADYYQRYFIGYNTTTRVLSIVPQDDFLHIVVDFTGDFPGGQAGGVFNVRFEGEKIAFVHADLA